MTERYLCGFTKPEGRSAPLLGASPKPLRLFLIRRPAPAAGSRASVARACPSVLNWRRGVGRRELQTIRVRVEPQIDPADVTAITRVRLRCRFESDASDRRPTRGTGPRHNSPHETILPIRIIHA